MHSCANQPSLYCKADAALLQFQNPQQLGILCGWIIWPLLWFVDKAVSWSAMLPGAFASASNIDPRLAWCYYALLILIVSVVLLRWPAQGQPHTVNAMLQPLPQPHKIEAASPLLSRPLLRYAAAVIVILAAGVTIAAAPPGGQAGTR